MHLIRHTLPRAFLIIHANHLLCHSTSLAGGSSSFTGDSPRHMHPTICPADPGIQLPAESSCPRMPSMTARTFAKLGLRCLSLATSSKAGRRSGKAQLAVRGGGGGDGCKAAWTTEGDACMQCVCAHFEQGYADAGGKGKRDLEALMEKEGPQVEGDTVAAWVGFDHRRKLGLKESGNGWVKEVARWMTGFVAGAAVAGVAAWVWIRRRGDQGSCSGKPEPAVYNLRNRKWRKR